MPERGHTSTFYCRKEPIHYQQRGQECTLLPFTKGFAIDITFSSFGNLPIIAQPQGNKLLGRKCRLKNTSMGLW